jgi:hypothetical protein
MKWFSGRYGECTRQRRAIIPRVLEVLEIRTLLADGIAPSPGPAITATAGVPIIGADFASYEISDPSGEPGTQWRAIINFGDGHDDFLIIPVQEGNEFEFVDSHTYAAPGTYKVTVNIAVPGSMMPDDNTVTTQVTVVPGTPKPPPSPHLSGSGLTFKAKPGQTFRHVVARFNEINYPGRAFQAKIDWGDTSDPGSGQIRRAGSNRFTVTGSHQYSAPGTYQIHVQIQDSAGRAIAIQSSAFVVNSAGAARLSRNN